MADAAPTLMERAIEATLRVFAPRRAAVRAHHRRMAVDGDYAQAFHLAARLRGYKSAQPGKNKTPWLNASDRSADGELVPSLRAMRNKSRAAGRDDSIGAGILGTFGRNVVGTGFRPQACVVDRDGTPNKAKNDALDAVWKERSSRLSPAEGELPHGVHQSMVYERRLEDGEVFLKPSVSAPGEPVWIETVEAERVETPSDAKPLDPDKRAKIVNGVEKDRFGRVVAYWVRVTHPGDTGLQNTVGGVGMTAGLSTTKASFVRVPASLMKHVRRGVRRAGQSRGVPLFHSCLQDLIDLDLLFLAALKRTQLASCLAMFIQSTAAGTDLLQLTAEDYGYQLDQALEPGMIFRLFPNEQAQFLQPHGIPDLWPLFMICARRIGASVGLSPQAVLRAWEGINYSGARTILIDDRNAYRCERSEFDDEVLDWEWRVVQEDALLRGDARLVTAGVTIADVDKVDWIANGEAWVDPNSDSKATQAALAMGLTNTPAECAKQGTNWQENIRKQFEFERGVNEMRQAMGLAPLPPGSFGFGSSAAAIAAAKADDSAEKDDESEGGRVDDLAELRALVQGHGKAAA